jgi:hypothetical protein
LVMIRNPHPRDRYNDVESPLVLFENDARRRVRRKISVTTVTRKRTLTFFACCSSYYE